MHPERIKIRKNSALQEKQKRHSLFRKLWVEKQNADIEPEIPIGIIIIGKNPC